MRSGSIDPTPETFLKLPVSKVAFFDASQSDGIGKIFRETDTFFRTVDLLYKP